MGLEPITYQAWLVLYGQEEHWCTQRSENTKFGMWEGFVLRTYSRVSITLTYVRTYVRTYNTYVRNAWALPRRIILVYNIYCLGVAWST